MRLKFLLATLYVLLAVGDIWGQGGAQTVHELKHKSITAIRVHYLLFLPIGYEEGDARWPLMLFLHGAGERGDDIRLVAKHGPPKIVKNNPQFPFILVSPQCPRGKSWSSRTLLALLEHIVENYRVKRSRIYVTGLSMGGYGAWDLGLSYPEKFAAIAPICGGGSTLEIRLNRRDDDSPLKTLAVWAFHGAKDPIVPPRESRRMVEALKQIGCRDVELTVYPEAKHDAWSKTYDNPQLYRWFLQHYRE